MVVAWRCTWMAVVRVICSDAMSGRSPWTTICYWKDLRWPGVTTVGTLTCCRTSV